MEKFARIVVGYHGCERKLADGLLTGKVAISEWNKSDNAYDWLGEGIYFWEHSPARALRWATERFGRRAAVIGAVIQLGTCFDLLDERITALLAVGYPALAQSYAAASQPLPANKGKNKKLRELDCAVINYCVYRAGLTHIPFDTVPWRFSGRTTGVSRHDDFRRNAHPDRRPQPGLRSGGFSAKLVAEDFQCTNRPSKNS